MSAQPWHRQSPVAGGVYVFNGNKQRFVRLARMWVVECDGEPEVLMPGWDVAVASLAVGWQITGVGDSRVAEADDGGHRWKVYAVDVEEASALPAPAEGAAS